MKIIQFEIKGYKSISNIDVKSISKINMLYGYNNSGKSNILKILKLIFEKKAGGTVSVVGDDTQTFQSNTGNKFWEGVIENSALIYNLNAETSEIYFKVIFKIEKNEIKNPLGSDYSEFAKLYFEGNQNSSIPFQIEGVITPLSFENSQIKLKVVKINKRLALNVNKNGENIYLEFVESKDPKSKLLPIRYQLFEKLMRNFNDCILFIDNDRFFSNETETQISFEDLRASTLKNWLYKIYLNPELYGKFKELTEFIKKFKVVVSPEDRILLENEESSPFKKMHIGFSKSQNNIIDLMFEIGKKRLPFSNFGTGIQQILYILTKIYSTDSKIIFVEELELSLSPKYQQEIIKHINILIESKKINQLFFTSHSKYLTYRGDFSIYEINIDKLGNSSSTKKTAVNKNFFDLAKL